MSNASDFVIENGVLKRYVGSGGDVVIPDGVTSIGFWTFRGCTNLTSITVPESVTIINSFAFDSCINLTNVEAFEKAGQEILGEYGCLPMINGRKPSCLSELTISSWKTVC